MRIEFDERIVIGPDWDFLTRVAESARFGYINQPTCLYRVHTTNVTVRTNRQKKISSLAICREKAIHLRRFAELPIPTRYYAFYDLLVNLLPGLPEKQDEVLSWSAFRALGVTDQARLMRLMSSHEISRDGDTLKALAWLQKSRQLDSSNRKTWLLSLLLRFSPGLCRWVLRIRSSARTNQLDTHPFGNLV